LWVEDYEFLFFWKMFNWVKKLEHCGLMIKQETALPSALYELLSVLHLLGILALQEANNCLTAKATADGYLPRVTEGKNYFFPSSACRWPPQQ
jgi:hypothetical protein